MRQTTEEDTGTGSCGAGHRGPRQPDYWKEFRTYDITQKLDEKLKKRERVRKMRRRNGEIMIRLGNGYTEETDASSIRFCWEGDLSEGGSSLFQGKYMEILPLTNGEKVTLLVGCGKREELTLLGAKELGAKAAAATKQYRIAKAVLDVKKLLLHLGKEALVQIVVGLGLGRYTCAQWKSEEKKEKECEFILLGAEGMTGQLQEGLALQEGTVFARNMVNTPGNLLRPMDFERSIRNYLEGTDIECHTLMYGQLKTMGMAALSGVGGSSEYPPCMLVLRYHGAPESEERFGLIGKGVTCDTGGYCLKGAGTMGGIKGDMAGAAAVAAAIKMAAQQKLAVNVTACLPLAENRISNACLLPGDVITGYSGKTIEVLNTDAEGRLILSDAISYAVREEGVSKVLDIATLTGAVANMLGNTIGGSMSDNEEFYELFQSALDYSAERFLRIPYGKEHRKMIDSDVADLKNIGAGHCGTITAGLFLREFCEGRPWIHLDIAGTAWCGTPTYAFESQGATGAAVGTLYYMLKEAAV